MLLLAVVLGIAAGLLAGGRISNLLSVQFRYGILILIGLVLRLGTQWLIDQGVDIVDQLRLPLLMTSFGLLLLTLWLNRSQPGLLLAMVGIGANGLAIALNGGYMPVYLSAVEMAGSQRPTCRQPSTSSFRASWDWPSFKPAGRWATCCPWVSPTLRMSSAWVTSSWESASPGSSSRRSLVVRPIPTPAS